jgi:Spy/CpxP family protein refolding chaperone
MNSKYLLAAAAVMIALSATPAAYAGKAKASKHKGHHKAHHIKGWKACKGTYKFLKGGKCLDSRDKKSK